MKNLSKMSKTELIELCEKFEKLYKLNSVFYPFCWMKDMEYDVGDKVLWHDYVFVCNKAHISKDFEKDRKYWSYE